LTVGKFSYFSEDEGNIGLFLLHCGNHQQGYTSVVNLNTAIF